MNTDPPKKTETQQHPDTNEDGVSLNTRGQSQAGEPNSRPVDRSATTTIADEQPNNNNNNTDDESNDGNNNNNTDDESINDNNNNNTDAGLDLGALYNAGIMATFDSDMVWILDVIKIKIDNEVAVALIGHGYNE